MRTRRSDSRLEEVLVDSGRGENVEVGLFDRSSLLEKRLLLEVLGNEGCSLVGIFLGDVARDCTALVEDVSIVVLFRAKCKCMKDRRAGHRLTM